MFRLGDREMMRYQHGVASASEQELRQIPASARKYAGPRGNYIHPLRSPGGVPLTADWAHDHPHHRGIYWAWPEVVYGGQTGDLHAVQRIFARPEGTPVVTHGAGWAECEAISLWKWEDTSPIVREQTRIRFASTGADEYWVDLDIRLVALAEGVTIARRDTHKYGGLNMRWSPARDFAVRPHADPPGAIPRMAWCRGSGRWGGGEAVTTITVFENAGNPCYPADCVQYPELPWFGPAFPAPHTRHALQPGEPLRLQYRIWVKDAPPASEADTRAEWLRFNPK